MATQNNFDMAADSYNEAGELQLGIARALSSNFPDLSPCPNPKILEIGCGTGFLTRLLFDHFRQAATYVVSDYQAAMLHKCRASFNGAANSSYVQFDGESPPFPPRSFDLIVSSMTFQWFKEPAASIRRLQSLLKPGGELLYSSVGSSNFAQWRAHLERHGLDSGMRRDLPAPYPGQFREDIIARDYGSARGFLDMLKNTGAGHSREGHTRSQLRTFKQACDTFDGQVDWHIVFGRLRSPEF